MRSVPLLPGIQAGNGAVAADLAKVAYDEFRAVRRNLNLVAVAFALTALSYGLARFAYGLLLPQIRADLALDVTEAGWIGGSAFAAYCAGIVFSFSCNGGLGPRTITLLAGLAATLGMGCVVLATSGLSLGLGIALAGLSTGLTSPPLAAAVSMQFSEQNRPKANAMINAGTAVGIILSGMAALIAAGAWRELYTLFALIGGGVTVWLWFAVPPGRIGEGIKGFQWAILKRSGLFALCCSAFLMGLSSTAIWTFGADILRNESGFTDSHVAWAWIALGAAGISGGLTGIFTNRYGKRRVHRFALLGMAIGTLGLAMASVSSLYGFVAMGVFGAAYIVSTGAYLIQGIDLLPDRPDLGLGIPFLVLALGQTAGNPLFGATLAAVGVINALVVFASAAFVAIAIYP
ncbi:MFS transporter [Halopseudomonas bauzanensis]|uniref:MFS transporter n=1 Tax=Halopseudomonas bauzanensis TaxID=653930 RepID=A0A4U0YJ50_9GAMM|nr:MFS transporter [Halopseudomonas bauzanensis]